MLFRSGRDQRRAAPAAVDHDHAAAIPCKVNRRSQPGGATANDDGVVGQIGYNSIAGQSGIVAWCAGPICAASSTCRICGALASASEKIATVRVPVAQALRMIRQASPPQFAVSGDWIIAYFFFANKFAKSATDYFPCWRRILPPQLSPTPTLPLKPRSKTNRLRPHSIRLMALAQKTLKALLPENPMPSM